MRALAQDKAKGTTASQSPAKAGAHTPSRPTTATGTAAELRQRLGAVLATVDVNDPQSLAKAREPALREILLWEFGDDFRQSSQFLPMVTSIGEAMDADARLQAQFVQMIQSLKS